MARVGPRRRPVGGDGLPTDADRVAAVARFRATRTTDVGLSAAADEVVRLDADWLDRLSLTVPGYAEAHGHSSLYPSHRHDVALWRAQERDLDRRYSRR